MSVSDFLDNPEDFIQYCTAINKCYYENLVNWYQKYLLDKIELTVCKKRNEALALDTDSDDDALIGSLLNEKRARLNIEIDLFHIKNAIDLIK